MRHSFTWTLLLPTFMSSTDLEEGDLVCWIRFGGFLFFHFLRHIFMLTVLVFPANLRLIFVFVFFGGRIPFI